MRSSKFRKPRTFEPSSVSLVAPVSRSYPARARRGGSQVRTTRADVETTGVPVRYLNCSRRKAREEGYLRGKTAGAPIPSGEATGFNRSIVMPEPEPLFRSGHFHFDLGRSDVIAIRAQERNGRHVIGSRRDTVEIFRLNFDLDGMRVISQSPKSQHQAQAEFLNSGFSLHHA